MKTAFFAETTPEVAVMAMHACVFSRRCFNRASLAQKFVRLGAHVGAVVLQLADLRRLSLSHTWLCSALLTTMSSSALFDATPSCPHGLSGPVLHTYVSDSSTQSPDALFSIILKPPTGVFSTTDRPPAGYRPAIDRRFEKKKKKKKKKFWCSRLGTWEMPIVLSTIWFHDLATGRCRSCSLLFSGLYYFRDMRNIRVYLYIYNTMDNQHLNDEYASVCDVYEGTTQGHHARVIPCTSPLCFTRPSFFFSLGLFPFISL